MWNVNSTGYWGETVGETESVEVGFIFEPLSIKASVKVLA
jgi:hypothetical protein